MKICVLGAGVIGVSTAYALGRLGHEVLVIEKAPDVAMGASYANGAQLSYSYIDPLASPATLKKLPRYLLGHDKALHLRFSPDLAYIRWALSFLRNCSSSRFEANREQRQALAELSSAAFESLTRDMPGKFDPTGRGKLVLAQNQAEYETMKMDKDFVMPERCLEIEPSLRDWKGEILGAIFSENDFALNSVNYCKILKTQAEEKFNVRYYFDETISKIVSVDGRVAGVKTDKDIHTADKVIVCLGNEALAILKPLGILFPIYPAKGYSLTLNSKESSPKVSVTDLKNKVVYANLGDKFRIAGFVDVNQRPENSSSRVELLLEIARQTWPDAADFNGPLESWTGARPMMPSGVPIIKQSKVEGLYLNLGHGSLGYTFAAGSAMKIASLIGHIHKNTAAIQGRNNAA